MNSRQRFLEVMRFNISDHIPLFCLFQQFEIGTLKRWQREGLPKDVHPIQYFDFERIELVPINVGCLPDYQSAKLENVEDWRAETDGKLRRDIQHKIDIIEQQFPMKDRSDWPAIQKLLNPECPARYPRFWKDYLRVTKGREYPLGVHINSPFGNLLEWMGIQGLTNAMQNDKAWITEMLGYLSNFTVGIIRKVTQDLDLDFAILQEANAYQITKVISISKFRQIFLSSYRRIVECLYTCGIPNVLMEERGNVADLIPLWLDIGINGIYFLEVSAGLDALKLRRQYGRRLVLIGNIDHYLLTSNKRNITEEVLSKVPVLLEKGGYIPAPDCPLSSEVSFDNYESYLELIKKVCG